MIVTRTPFRVTLGGGGTDLPSFYEKHGGFVLAMGIDKYMYVFLNRPIVENRVILHYTRSESVEHVSELQHELAREALKLNGIETDIEISSLADIPASTGLGSSSCYLVGLLMAIHTYRKDYISLEKLAEEACRIELELLKKGIGKQDQYMAAFGGLTALEFAKGGAVSVKRVHLNSWAAAELVSNCHIYYLRKKRDAIEALHDQNAAMLETSARRKQVEKSLLEIKDIGANILKAVQNENFDEFGKLMHAHWENKKRLSEKVSYPEVDQLYDYTRSEFGVTGGKILGAGSGGFLMLYCPESKKELTAYMHAKGYPRLNYTIENQGTEVVASSGSAGSEAYVS